jgi:hypothetical protein
MSARQGLQAVAEVIYVQHLAFLKETPMNKKLIGTVLGTLAFGGMTVNARAEEAPSKEASKEAKDAKAEKKEGNKDKKGANKACGGPNGCGEKHPGKK